jgi:hypothetical protein
MVEAPDLGSGCWGFESLLGHHLYSSYGLVAEWLRSGLQNRVRVFNSPPDLQSSLACSSGVEHSPDKTGVGGSKPPSPTNYFLDCQALQQPLGSTLAFKCQASPHLLLRSAYNPQ